MTRGLFGFAVALGVVAVTGYWAGALGSGPSTMSWSSGPTITQLDPLRELVVTKISVSDILTARDSGYSGFWLIKGDALLSVDLKRSEIVDVDKAQRTATIRLPDPQVISPRVDFEKTKTWDIKSVSWIPWRGDEDEMRDKAMFHAQRLVEFAASSDESMKQAKAHAEMAITAAYQMVDWQVKVEWPSTDGRK
jgi:hypothetical protein